MYKKSPDKAFDENYLLSEDWYNLLGRSFSYSSSGSGLIGFASALSEKLNCDSVLILHFPASTGPCLLFETQKNKYRSNTLEEYLAGSYSIDPFYLARDECRAAGVRSIQDVIEEDYGTNEYYKTHFAGAALVDEVCFFCSDGQSGHVVLSLCRAKGKGLFSKNELRALMTISPLVRSYMRANWRDLEGLTPSCDEDAMLEAEQLHRHIENARMNFGKTILTDREFSVLQLLLRGDSIDLISRKLGMSTGTAKVHRKHIYSKLNITSQPQVFTLFLEVVSATSYQPNTDPLVEYLIPAD